MEDISNVSINPLINSNFLIPRRVKFVQNGQRKLWDGISEHSDVQILVFNASRNVFVFVKQFRPAVYLSRSKTSTPPNSSIETIDTQLFPGHLGVTIELCAGIVDKDLPAVEIAKAEVLEECGYDVPASNFLKITSCRNGTDIAGSQVTLYYVEVTDAMRVSSGGGLADEGEFIEVVEMSVKETRNLIFDESINREPCLLVALQWFFHNMYSQVKLEEGDS
ncbi:uridine diphosphate glucose pyrophosphatase [Elysia marginata]|uniref:Uridine diphosphate glucose pyrophosphatase NUDT14 n=1 Tax=Elysia marginata TaxID=1093978 RepID=A0AAV4FN40_9GAST|nr:uridine diphosphate glucose pyrophosphatase [Elysia marginata]